MTLTTSLTKAQRADENRAYVRELLWQRQPEFAAALAAAERVFPFPACPCRQRAITGLRPSARSSDQLGAGHREAESARPARAEV
jgi:hypothetical protein